ncbi:hypothetical protein ATS73_015185 [Pseudoalteromonas sp. H100]|nr:hypothetical protein [Pseudoalteromonas sp. H100]WFO19253.1 hypothetical protein ATS73_015185 [Pseudoalteromonas sp. H100]
MFKNNTLSLAIISALSVFALTGCGGGGGSNTTPAPVTPPTSSTPTWTAGVFEPSDELKNFCETPRTGNDPFNNNEPYPDQAGSALYEKLWLRSWSDETYLWYDEIADNDPESFDTVADYFAQLKTEELTDSGAKKITFIFQNPLKITSKKHNRALPLVMVLTGHLLVIQPIEFYVLLTLKMTHQLAKLAFNEAIPYLKLMA